MKQYNTKSSEDNTENMHRSLNSSTGNRLKTSEWCAKSFNIILSIFFISIYQGILSSFYFQISNTRFKSNWFILKMKGSVSAEIPGNNQVNFIPLHEIAKIQNFGPAA